LVDANLHVLITSESIRCHVAYVRHISPLALVGIASSTAAPISADGSGSIIQEATSTLEKTFQALLKQSRPSSSTSSSASGLTVVAPAGADGSFGIILDTLRFVVNAICKTSGNPTTLLNKFVDSFASNENAILMRIIALLEVLKCNPGYVAHDSRVLDVLITVTNLLKGSESAKPYTEIADGRRKFTRETSPSRRKSLANAVKKVISVKLEGGPNDREKPGSPVSSSNSNLAFGSKPKTADPVPRSRPGSSRLSISMQSGVGLASTPQAANFALPKSLTFAGVDVESSALSDLPSGLRHDLLLEAGRVSHLFFFFFLFLIQPQKKKSPRDFID
jgi:hypothetical protein